MIIFPAVDIKEGKSVRLVQGRRDQQTVYGDDPVEMALRWEREGAEWLHVVDLDGAFSGVPRNKEIISQMASRLSIPMQLGGGIRDLETAGSYLDLGVARIVVGTRAASDPDFVAELLDAFGPERIVVGIDARSGLVTVRGWEENTGLKALELAERIKRLGVQRAVYTDVSRDGLLEGPNFEAIGDMAGHSGLLVIASGGVTTVEDLQRLAVIPGVEGAIIGKALYENKITLEAALAAVRR